MNTTSARPWCRSGTILAIVDFLKKNGYEPKDVISDAAMKLADAYDPYRQVDMLHVNAVFQKVVDVTGRPDMGLRLGLSVDLERMGAFGFLFMNAPTVGDALIDYVRYGPVFQTQTHFGLKRSKEQFCIEYSSNHPDVPGWELDSEVTVGYMMRIVNTVAGRSVTPEKILFDHNPICKLSDYLRLLSVCPSFGRRLNQIYYPLALLEQTISGANPMLYKVMSHHMVDLANDMPREDILSDVVRNNIRRGLGTDTVTLEHIASELGIEPRTLQRRLGEADSSFQKLLDQVRLEMANYYLERTTLGITEIAFELGYAEASVFSRAFKRWTGLAPGPYRKSKLQ